MPEPHATTSLLRDGFLLLGAAVAFVLLFRRLGLGATLGYLVAGAVMGPYVLGLVGGAEAKIGIAELGIVLLLFVVGLELEPRRLWRMKGEIFGLGLAQVVLCGLALAAMIGLGTQFSWAAALALGLPLALSSTAQVLPMLQSAGRLRTPFGERAFAVLLFQDLSLIPLITIIAAMNRNPAVADGPPGWQLALYTVGAIAGLIAAGRFFAFLRPDSPGILSARPFWKPRPTARLSRIREPHLPAEQPVQRLLDRLPFGFNGRFLYGRVSVDF